jgi:hypothetical protein
MANFVLQWQLHTCDHDNIQSLKYLLSGYNLGGLYI